MSIFEVDPDIANAKTLSSNFYTDERYFDLSKEKIFAMTWQFLGHTNEVENLKPAILFPKFLDEPVLIVKNEESLVCLSNVCTHRGKILVEEPCVADLIKCRYHGRRFSLDGTFLSMPEFEGVKNFPCESDNLRYLAFAERAGFMFASIEPVNSFEAFVADSEARLSDIDTRGMRLSGAKTYEIDAHWALYCENYLEGFHIPFVHRSLNELIDYGTYTTELFRYSSLQTGFNEKGETAARYLFIFPNLMFNYYPWGISVNVVNPITSSKTSVDFFTYTRDGSDTGAGDDLHAVEMEDEAVVESVQKGIRSRFYTHGRYSPTREQGTHHFHRLIAEFMG